MEDELQETSSVEENIEIPNLVEESNVRDIHAYVAASLLICTFGLLVPVAVFGYLARSYNSTEDSDIAIILLITIAGLWCTMFVTGLLLNVFLRTTKKRSLEPDVYMRLFLSAFKVCTGGTLYAGVWILIFVFLLIDPRDHLIQLLSCMKLASTHFIIAYFHRDSLNYLSVNSVLGIAYLAGGLICYSVPESELFTWVTFVSAITCVSLASVTIIMGYWLLSGGLLVLASTSFLTFLGISVGLTTIVLIGGLLLTFSGLWVTERALLTNTIALIYGPWHTPISKEERAPLIPTTNSFQIPVSSTLT